EVEVADHILGGGDGGAERQGPQQRHPDWHTPTAKAHDPPCYPHRSLDVFPAGVAALPALDVPARVLFAPFGNVRRGGHQALGQCDAWGEDNLVIATGAWIADKADGEKNSDHRGLLIGRAAAEPGSGPGCRGLPQSAARARPPRALPERCPSAAEHCPRALP